MIGMMASAPVWRFSIFWAPDFPYKRFAFESDPKQPVVDDDILRLKSWGHRGQLAFIAAAAGGWSVNAACKMALLLCSLRVLPVSATPLLPSVWPAVALVTLAVAAHCGYAASLCTLVSDTVPREAVSSVAVAPERSVVLSKGAPVGHPLLPLA